MEKELIRLRAKVQGIIATSEYKSKKLNGVLCSRADLEMIDFMAEIHQKQGNFNGYMVNGNVKEVFDKLNIK